MTDSEKPDAPLQSTTPGLVRQIYLSRDLRAYDGFFDHDWVSEIYTFVEQSPIRQATHDLCAAWKGASNARRMAHLSITLVKNAIEGVINGRVPMPLEAIRGLCDSISSGGGRSPGGSRKIRLNKANREEIVKRIRGIEARVVEADESVRVSEEDMWAWYLTNPEMQLSLWAAEQSAYCAIYFAYEHFLIRTMKLVGGHGSLRTNRLASELRDYFGKGHSKSVWDNPARRLAEMKRDAIVHNGNRLTDELQGCKKDLTLVNAGEFSISAEETNALFSLVKGCVKLHAAAVVGLGSLPAAKPQKPEVNSA